MIVGQQLPQLRPSPCLPPRRLACSQQSGEARHRVPPLWSTSPVHAFEAPGVAEGRARSERLGR